MNPQNDTTFDEIRTAKAEETLLGSSEGHLL